ncbi:unnamed protein product [Callosobruchus maculatus]|uniref:Uncharacterized protein n=1 Tax=Callosobruchus maculatus TaxID=64391 RepID=A0A653BLJ2_CALMS|nr:unnamed protein product [Callosobruchus maculatus]
MGGDLSKSKDVTEHVTESTWSSQDSPPLMKYDEWMLQVITEDLEKDTEMFVVNNMLMSVQFLENYEKEVLDEAILETENELNKTLLKELKLSFIKPDHVLEVVNQKVRFVPSPTVSQESTSAIASRRVYVVNTMFDVVSTFEEHQYTTVDKPIYRVKLEQSTHTTDKQNKKIPGYLRLKLTEHTHFTDCPVSSALKKTKDFKDPDLTSSESASSNHHPKAKPDVAEYDVIIKNNTPKPINVEASMLKDCLPLYCFTTQLNEKRATDICMQSEEVNGNLAQIKLFDKTIYVDAQGYMRYFKNNIFPKSLGRNLGFSDREVQVQARSIRGKVLCKSEGQGNDIFECEWPCKKYFEEDKIKISHILLFFAEHFMSLASYSFQKSTIKQTRFFLRQAWYLSKIKENLGTAHSEKEFKDLQQNIGKLEGELYRKELITEGPAVSSNVDDSLQQEDDHRTPVQEVPSASDEQVEIRVEPGRKKNKGKSVSFLEPS